MGGLLHRIGTSVPSKGAGEGAAGPLAPRGQGAYQPLLPQNPRGPLSDTRAPAPTSLCPRPFYSPALGSGSLSPQPQESGRAEFGTPSPPSLSSRDTCSLLRKSPPLPLGPEVGCPSRTREGRREAGTRALSSSVSRLSSREPSRLCTPGLREQTGSLSPNLWEPRPGPSTPTDLPERTGTGHCGQALQLGL